MKKSLFWAIAIAFLLAGCAPKTTSPTITINTYNMSKNSNIPPKSTQTYPGSTPIQTAPTEPITEDMGISSSSATPIEPSSETMQELGTDGYAPPKPRKPIVLSHDSKMIKIAVLIPQKVIKKYAITTVNTVIAYLLHENVAFDLNVFNSGDEKEASILTALSDIRAQGYDMIIAPVTLEGGNVVVQEVRDRLVFIPTLHHSAIPNAGENIIFGGIDYHEQIMRLTPYANERVGLFDDGSMLSSQLNGFVYSYHDRIFSEKRIESAKTDFKKMFKSNTSLNNASYYLNTPLVTTSLIASQLRSNSIYPHALLSTQINYNPLLLTLTQYEDRSNMFIANSIQRSPASIEEINALFGHDIVYDWVNYTTSLGADLLVAHFYGEAQTRLYKETIINNQVMHQTKIVKPDRYSFTPVTLP